MQVQSCGLLPKHHMRGCQGTTWLLSAALVMLTLSWVCDHANAQTHVLTTPPAAVAAEVATAYGTLRDWLDTFELPAPDDPASLVAMPSASGVCLMLRRSGTLLAVATDTSGDDLMIRRVAGRAFGQVLGHPSVTNLPQAIRNAAGQHLTIELEVAGVIEPVIERDLERLEAGLEPGLDGLALRRGQRLAMAFPARLLALDRANSVSSMMADMIGDLELRGQDVKAMLARQDVSMYRFRTVHLAQARPAQTPRVTYRGMMPLHQGHLTPDVIIAAADSLARHVNEVLPDTTGLRLGMRGQYRPQADLFDPPLATPLEQTLLSLALRRFAALPHLDLQQSTAMVSTAHRVLADLAMVEAVETNPLNDMAACGGIVLAVLEDASVLQQDPVVARLYDNASHQLDASFQMGKGFHSLPQSGESRPLSAHSHALLSAAWARQLRKDPGRVDATKVRQAIDIAWRTANSERQVALLPWIAWAEIDYAAAVSQPLANIDRMSLLLELLDAIRIGGPEAPPDLVGGFALQTASSQRSQVIRADSQSLRPALFVATALSEPALVDPAARPALLERHLQSVRFLLQLMVREDSRTQQPLRNAIGGIRAAAWSNRQPAAAQAMGLLILADTIPLLDR